MALTARQRRRKFVRFLKNHGFANPRLIGMAVRVTHIRRAEACALLVQESGGGRNVFGCDYGATGDRPPYCGHPVTATRLIKLRRSGRYNGVGPTQLTYGGFVDMTSESSDPKLLAKRMREVGIAWAARPFLNMLKGFSIWQSYRREGSVFYAGTRYNGAEAYGHQIDGRVKEWQGKLSRIGL